VSVSPTPLLTLKRTFPGRGGQKFIERCVPKVAELRARFPDKDIEVDGGVSPKTIDVCAQAGISYFCLGANQAKADSENVCSGSNVIVAGTAIFGADKPEEVIATLKSVVNTAQAKVLE
jgi:ribulose-phosphate 3-epimerase